MRKSVRQIGNAGVDTAGNDPIAICRIVGNHEIGSRRNNKGIKVRVEEKPRAVPVQGAKITGKKPDILIVNKIQARGISREIRKGQIIGRTREIGVRK